MNARCDLHFVSAPFAQRCRHPCFCLPRPQHEGHPSRCVQGATVFTPARRLPLHAPGCGLRRLLPALLCATALRTAVLFTHGAAAPPLHIHHPGLDFSNLKVSMPEDPTLREFEQARALQASCGEAHRAARPGWEGRGGKHWGGRVVAWSPATRFAAMHCSRILRQSKAPFLSGCPGLEAQIDCPPPCVCRRTCWSARSRCPRWAVAQLGPQPAACPPAPPPPAPGQRSGQRAARGRPPRRLLAAAPLAPPPPALPPCRLPRPRASSRRGVLAAAGAAARQGGGRRSRTWCWTR